MAVVSLLFAALTWYLSTPGRESPKLAGSAPQRIGVYVSQQGVLVHTSAYLFWNARHPGLATENLYVAVSDGISAEKILLTSSARPERPISPVRRTRVFAGPRLARATPAWQWVTTVGALTRHATQYGALVATFTLSDVAETSRGSTFVHLPALAPNDSPFPSIPAEVLEDLRGGVQDLIDYPVARPSGSGLKAGYIGYASSSDQTAFYDAQNLTTTESIDGLQSDLQKSAIDSDLPGDGTLEGADFVWQEDGPVEGYLTATELSATANQDRWQFAAGIAVGICVSSAVAFAQDPQAGALLSALRPRRRRRRSPVPPRIDVLQ